MPSDTGSLHRAPIGSMLGWSALSASPSLRLRSPPSKEGSPVPGSSSPIAQALGIGPEVALEPRVFRLFTLTGAAVSLLVVLPLNLAQGLTVWFDLTVVAFAVACVALFWDARHGVPRIKTFVGLAVLTID